MFWLFAPKACGILAPWPGTEPIPPALEGEAFTTGLPGKSQLYRFIKQHSALLSLDEIKFLAFIEKEESPNRGFLCFLHMKNSEEMDLGAGDSLIMA